ncbi:DNA repair protein RAD5 [Ceratocystis platani]|uniref:DNA repair protein RAD5 n=1 Tax=Ceratocystis fimbriata f. sp. platani TaxID=88771 RepID=A0A0F8DE21_CERFI|nr:DNA repair protein RAD5 [Ceratocystis platani]
MYLALRALNLELVRLPETAHTPQLRTLRAVFWQDVIEQTFAGSPPREPICVLLRHALDSLRDRDPEASLATLRFWTSRLVKMRRKYIDNRPFVSIAALEEYAEHTYSGIMYATLAAAGVQSTVADHLASHIGKACGIVAVLRGVPVLAAPQQQADGRAGRKEPVLLLPLDVLATHGVREEEVYRLGPQAHGFCDAIFEVATRANDHLLTAREMLANLKQGKEVGHAFEHGDEEGHNHEALNVSQEWRAIKHSFGVIAESYLAPIGKERKPAVAESSDRKPKPKRFFTKSPPAARECPTWANASATPGAIAAEAFQAIELKPKRFFTTSPQAQAASLPEVKPEPTPECKPVASHDIKQVLPTHIPPPPPVPIPSSEDDSLFVRHTDVDPEPVVVPSAPAPVVAFDEATFEAFVGQKVKRPILTLLRDHCGNNLELAVNMFFDGTWRSLEAAQKRAVQSAKANSVAATLWRDRPTQESPATARYIGVFGVEGWATRSGSGLVKYGDVVNIERHKISQPKLKGTALRGAKQKVDVVVRFTNKAGQEVGRLAKEAAVWISTLQDQKVARFEGTVVYAPDRLRTNDTIFIQLRAELLSSAFDQSKFQGPDMSARGVFEQDETAEERDLRLRQVALVKLFTEINLAPTSSGAVGKETQNTKDRRQDLLKAAELDDQGSRASDGLPGTQSPIAIPSSTQAEPEDGQVLEQDQLDALYRKAQSFDFNTPQATPADTFAMDLRPYQRQSLHWMMSKEKDEETHRKMSLHPLWEEYEWPTKDGDGNDMPAIDGVTKFYLNPYSGEMSLHFQAQEQNCLGGILADEMGLGKTIQMLSLVHSHRPGWREQQTKPDTRAGSGATLDTPPTSVFDLLTTPQATVQPAPLTTLVIAPMSLLAQWQSEAEKASKPGTIRTYVYYGAEKNANLQAMCTSLASAPDIVITSYGVVLSEFSQLAARNGDKTFHTGLFSLSFFRIIIDEAHTIKNRISKTAKACYGLAATHRWVLTGTPVVNRLEDLFSLVRFLGVEPWNNFSYWRTFITLPFEARNFVRALDVVQTVLEPLVMRRTKDMKTPSGEPLVPLPAKVIEIVEVELSQTERDIYNHVLAMAQNSLSENMANGTVFKAYTSIFAQIMRLRQVCCHPVLIRNRALVAEEADQAALADASDGLTDDMDLDHLLQKFSADVDQDAAAGDSKAKSFGAHALEQIRREADAECPICTEEPMEEQTVTGCWHSSCKKCLLEYMRHETDKGRQPRCVSCRQPINTRELYEVVRYDEDEGDETAEVTGGLDKSNTRISLQRLGSHDSSSKVMALVAHLRALRKEDAKAKAVVFSQFTSFLDIIEPALARVHIRFLRLDGSMAQKARAAVLGEFAASKRFTVLLLSLKAGGVGLNLTQAKRVYMMDPWWSFAAEAQAIDRVHRMGQTEEVKVYRFIVQSSVEVRMLKIQDRKKFIASSLGMMGEDEKKMARIEDIKELLGSG